MNPNNNNQNQPLRHNRNHSPSDVPRNQRPPTSQRLNTSRGQAVRAQKRSQMDAQRIADQYTAATAQPSEEQRRANFIDGRCSLKQR